MEKSLDKIFNKIYPVIAPLGIVDNDFQYVEDISKDRDIQEVHKRIKDILGANSLYDEEKEMFEETIKYRETPMYVLMNEYKDDKRHKKGEPITIKKIVHFIDPVSLKHIVLEQTKKDEPSNYYKIYKAIKNTDQVLRNNAICIARNVYWESLQNITGRSKIKELNLDDEEFAEYLAKQTRDGVVWLFLDIEPRIKQPEQTIVRKLTK
jgi:hypothetical protein